MDKLPFEVIRQIYSYDPTYKQHFDNVFEFLEKYHCFIYRCDQCCRHYNDCYCCCNTCRTFLRF